MEAVGNPQACYVTDAPIEHISAARHNETDIVAPLEHLCGGLDEVLRTLLVGDSAEEGDDFVLHSPLNKERAAAGEIHRIVDRDDLRGVYSVFVYDYVAGEFADGDDLVGGLHTLFLQVINPRVYVLVACAVERSRVHVDHERFSGELLCGDAGKVGEPVVGVDYVKLVLLLESDRAAHHSVACDLLHKVGAVLAGELEFLSVGYAEILDLTRPFLLHYVLEILGAYIRNHIGAHVDELHLSEELVNAFAHGVNRDVARIYDFNGALVLVSRSRRHHKQHLDPVLGETLCHSIAGSAQTSCDMGRELPSKHQNSHSFSSLFKSSGLY